MKTSLRLLAGLLLAGLAGSLPAAISVTRLQGFNKNWQFINTDTVYTDMANSPSGYFKDYNGDGLPDYLVCLKSDAGAMRAFTLNNAAMGGAKTYANKTAGRDFAALPGVAMPQRIFTPRAPKSDTPDLVLESDNRSGTGGTWDTLVFERLNRANSAWPDEKAWSITMPFKASWVVQWPEYSYDGDDYPDFFIYNSQAPTDNRRFVLGLYSGQTGAQLWQRTLELDPGDTGSGITGYPPASNIIINALPLLPAGRIGSGDFDNDGKPEFYCYYTYGKGPTLPYTYNTMIKVLNSSGAPLAPYAAGWTRVGPANTALPLLSSFRADLDKDGYRDLVLTFPQQSLAPAAPVFIGYSLKKNQVLFQSVNSDFGSTANEASGFQTMETSEFQRYAPTDLTGDGKIDLTVFRNMGASGPLVIGLFHGVGGAGRKVWLSTAATFNYGAYNQAHQVANDFSYDNILDFALVKNPTAPSNPTWTIANTAVTAAGITLGKQLTYTSSATGTLGAGQTFHANSTTIGSFGDMDGNGQRDTWAGLFWEVDDSGVTQSAGGSLIVYNTPPPSNPAAAARIAALDLLVTDQNWYGAPLPAPARIQNGCSFVDNDGDKVSDDITVTWDNAVFALNFTARGIYPASGQALTPTPADGGSVAAGQPLRWEAPDGAYAQNSFEVYLGTSQTAVAGATHASPEYRGNLGFIASFLPRPALTAGTTYYWRIDSVNQWGQVTKGNVWRLGAKPATPANAIQGGKWELFR